MTRIPDNTNLSRRKALALTVSALGTGTAVNVVAITTAKAHADAELIALGAEFDRLEAAFHIADERERPRDAAYCRALAEMPPGSTNEQYAERLRQVSLELGPTTKPDADDITDAMDVPMRRIMTLPATTLAGLAVKARVTRFACSHFYRDNDHDTDWDVLIARKLIDAVLTFCGEAVS